MDTESSSKAKWASVRHQRLVSTSLSPSKAAKATTTTTATTETQVESKPKPFQIAKIVVRPHPNYAAKIKLSVSSMAQCRLAFVRMSLSNNTVHVTHNYQVYF